MNKIEKRSLANQAVAMWYKFEIKCNCGMVENGWQMHSNKLFRKYNEPNSIS